MNKLDSFNKDKVKCPKCKEYCNKKELMIHFDGKLCAKCQKIFIKFFDNQGFIEKLNSDIIYKEFLNEKQT
jgi:phage FluMu protein Com